MVNKVQLRAPGVSAAQQEEEEEEEEVVSPAGSGPRCW